MAKVKVKMNSSGALEVLNSDGVVEHLQGIAEGIKAAADAQTSVKSGMRNDNYIVKANKGTGRARASVIAANPHSIRQQQKNNTLIKCIGSGS